MEKLLTIAFWILAEMTDAAPVEMEVIIANVVLDSMVFFFILQKL